MCGKLNKYTVPPYYTARQAIQIDYKVRKGALRAILKYKFIHQVLML